MWVQAREHVHQYAWDGGLHWSGDCSPFDRFDAADTASSCGLSRSLANCLRVAVSHRSAPDRQALARGTMWSMATWPAADTTLSSYGLNQDPDTARHSPSRTTS